MRIAILTFHRAYNCGAMLQAWALKTVVERMGHIVEFPILDHVKDAPRWLMSSVDVHKTGLRLLRAIAGRCLIDLTTIPYEDIRRFRYRAFRRRLLPERICNPMAFDRHYDLVIVGSDQVWNPARCGDEFDLFLGKGFSYSLPKIAYAVSYGDSQLSDDDLKRVVDALLNFSSVSVRERFARDRLMAASGRSIMETLDPTLLLKAEDYSNVAGGSIPTEPYLLLYTVSLTGFWQRTAMELARRLGVRCVVVPCYQQSWFIVPSTHGVVFGVSPDRLVRLSRSAKYILAGSFHGTAMAVIFQKPFLALRAGADGCDSRTASLVRKICCLERVVHPALSLDEMERRLVAPLPDYERNLDSLRKESKEWLKNAIDCVVQKTE